jgi:hypothetical protein
MKRRRTWPLRILIAALVLIVLTGTYLAITHQETHPVDSGSPATAGPQGN